MDTCVAAVTVLASACLLMTSPSRAGDSPGASDSIRLNQIGFYPSGPKMAVVVDHAGGRFLVRDRVGATVRHEGKLGQSQTWDASGEKARIADFSAFSRVGEYVIEIPGLGRSHPFRIHPSVHLDLAKAAVKAFYFNRASTSLEKDHAGEYARRGGHFDTKVLIHSSAASGSRPEGTVISAPKGWYDAGDYNLYVVNSGVTCYALMALYEHYSDLFRTLRLNIPESRYSMPDVLDEVKWNIDWMLAMQDPADGGVYHKLTSKRFSGFVMPHKATAKRYVILKTTSAALCFAGVTATAARVYTKFDPRYAEKCLRAARKAYEWARANPKRKYKSPSDIKTGPYGSARGAKEWAAYELYIATGKRTYLDEARAKRVACSVPSWANVTALGPMSMAFTRKDPAARDAVKKLADGIVNTVQRSAYRVGMSRGDFHWGSNGVAAGKGMVLLMAYDIAGDRKYLDGAIAMLDYLLGRNATGYCFVTGFGSRPSMNPHHRVSKADGVKSPVPGFLVGGPNPGRQDRAKGYIGKEPARSYADVTGSYASNEVAINWNAPLAYLAGGLEALQRRGRK
ncbi:MAG: glycoside hydrolase family 9 protein [Planctomycetota bacterium]